MKQQSIKQKILELENKKNLPPDLESDKYAIEIAAALTKSPPQSYNDVGFDKLELYKPATAKVVLKVYSLLQTLVCYKSIGGEMNLVKEKFENYNSQVDTHNFQLLIGIHTFKENAYIGRDVANFIILGHLEHHIEFEL